MRKHIFLFFIILISLKGFSQEHTVYVDGNAVSANIASFTIDKSTSSRKDIIHGNPYYNKDWMYGELKIRNNKTYNGLFKYNVVHQQMEMVFEGDTFIISNPLYIEYVKFANITFIYSLIIDNSKEPGRISGSYFEAHNNLEDNYILLSQYIGDIKESDFGNKYAGGIGDGSKRYSQNVNYFVKLNNGPAEKVHLSKNSIKKLFSNEEDAVKDYIKENGLKMSNAHDVSTLFDYFNKKKVSDF